MTDFTIIGTKLPTIPQKTEYTIKKWVSGERSFTTVQLNNLVSYGEEILEGFVYIKAEVQDYIGDHYYFRKDIIDRLAEIQGMTNKGKLIGYKCPMNLDVWGIKVDDIFESCTGYTSEYKCKGYGLPKEIVETWEAVYQELQKQLTIGRTPQQPNGIEVTINKNGVWVDRVIVSIVDIKTLLRCSISSLNRSVPIATGYKQKEPYKVELLDATYKIGCSELKKSDLLKVVNAYDEIHGITS